MAVAWMTVPEKGGGMCAQIVIILESESDRQTLDDSKLLDVIQDLKVPWPVSVVYAQEGKSKQVSTGIIELVWVPRTVYVTAIDEERLDRLATGEQREATLMRKALNLGLTVIEQALENENDAGRS